MRRFLLAVSVLTLMTQHAHAETFRILGDAPYCTATVIQGPNPRGASAAAPKGRPIIVIDPAVLARLPYLRPFVLAHECAHHALGHTSPAGLLREGHLFHDKELEADCWAARALSEAGEQGVVEAQIELFEAREDSGPGPRYPDWHTRSQMMKSCAVR